MNRDSAFELLQQHTKSDSLIKHMLAVEACMRAYAVKFGEDDAKWGIVGLLHDFDYEMYPNPPDHPEKGAEILKDSWLSRRRHLRDSFARRLHGMSKEQSDG